MKKKLVIYTNTKIHALITRKKNIYIVATVLASVTGHQVIEDLSFPRSINGFGAGKTDSSSLEHFTALCWKTEVIPSQKCEQFKCEGPPPVPPGPSLCWVRHGSGLRSPGSDMRQPPIWGPLTGPLSSRSGGVTVPGHPEHVAYPLFGGCHPQARKEPLGWTSPPATQGRAAGHFRGLSPAWPHLWCVCNSSKSIVYTQLFSLS